MKKIFDFFVAILIIAAVGSLIYFMYQRGSARQNRELARRIAELSPTGGPPIDEQDLRRAIALYEDQIERNVREGAQTGVYWKILATRLSDTNQHNETLSALERAIYYNTDDPVLYYLTGVSAANVAKSRVTSPNEREHFFKVAENAHLRALQLDITYTRPMYALAIMYVYELNRPQDAIVQLERYLQILPSDINAMFVLASAYYMTRSNTRALEVLDRIIDRTKDNEIKQQAWINKDIILSGGTYE